MAYNAVQNGKGARLGVHGGHVSHILDFLGGHLGTVKPEPIVEVLLDEGDGILGAVLVWGCHVAVIEEEDKLPPLGGSIDAAAALLEVLIHYVLEREGARLGAKGH